jgi:hypothetical protein
VDPRAGLDDVENIMISNGDKFNYYDVLDIETAKEPKLAKTEKSTSCL